MIYPLKMVISHDLPLKQMVFFDDLPIENGDLVRNDPQ